MKKTNHIEEINNIIYITLKVYFKQDWVNFLKNMSGFKWKKSENNNKKKHYLYKWFWHVYFLYKKCFRTNNVAYFISDILKWLSVH